MHPVSLPIAYTAGYVKAACSEASADALTLADGYATHPTEIVIDPKFVENIQEVVPLSQIDYVVMNHTEPDHAGAIEKVLELNPRAVVVGTSTALSFLKEIINHDFNARAVQDGDTLSLGGKTLRFLVLPQLHWPDTMYTYVEEDGILFTCDSFGSHYSHPGIVRSAVTDYEGYLRATKYYFDNIIGPFRHPFMNDALERIKDLKLNFICTGHGPVHDSHIDEIIALYRQWCAVPAPREKKLVVIPYACIIHVYQ